MLFSFDVKDANRTQEIVGKDNEVTFLLVPIDKMDKGLL